MKLRAFGDWLLGLLVAILCLLAAGSALAQEPKPMPPASPVLDELETAWATIAALRVQLIRVQSDLDTCRVESAQVRSSKVQEELRALSDDLRARINARHPGWTWSPETGLFSRLPPEGTNGVKK